LGKQKRVGALWSGHERAATRTSIIGDPAKEITPEGPNIAELMGSVYVGETRSVEQSMPRYDATTALIVVDVQNDFADPHGSLYVRGGRTVVRRVNAEVRRALAAGALVVYTQDWHPAVTPHFAKDGGVWPVHCVADTWGAEFHPALRVSGPVVRKGVGGEDGYSGFTVRKPHGGEARPTELAVLLRSANIRRTVVVGLATDYCVRDTAIDAAGLGFETHVLEHAIRAVNLDREDGEHALASMREAGVIVE
jgi:nicotinamidase/pyrazinamidase